MARCPGIVGDAAHALHAAIHDLAGGQPFSLADEARPEHLRGLLALSAWLFLPLLRVRRRPISWRSAAAWRQSIKAASNGTAGKTQNTARSSNRRLWLRRPLAARQVRTPRSTVAPFDGPLAGRLMLQRRGFRTLRSVLAQ